jgi:hypothetical protein
MSYGRLCELVAEGVFTRGKFSLAKQRPPIYLRVEELNAWNRGGVDAVRRVRAQKRFAKKGDWPVAAIHIEGLTLRDWFAGQALIGILGARKGFLVDVGTDSAPGWAYQVADAMLAERVRTMPVAPADPAEILAPTLGGEQ